MKLQLAGCLALVAVAGCGGADEPPHWRLDGSSPVAGVSGAGSAPLSDDLAAAYWGQFGPVSTQQTQPMVEIEPAGAQLQPPPDAADWSMIVIESAMQLSTLPPGKPHPVHTVRCWNEPQKPETVEAPGTGTVTPEHRPDGSTRYRFTVGPTGDRAEGWFDVH